MTNEKRETSVVVKKQESTLVSKGIVPSTFEELLQFSKLLKATPKFLPKGKERYSVEELAVNIQQGLEIGLTVMQAIQGIMVVNGATSVWGDYMIGLVLSSGKLKTIKEWTSGDFPGDDYTAHCLVHRHGITDGIEKIFSIEDAKKAGLATKELWKKYPKRMLSMRARSWALRDMFGDVLKGLVAVEEAVDYDSKDEQRVINEIKSTGYKETDIAIAKVTGYSLAEVEATSTESGPILPVDPEPEHQCSGTCQQKEPQHQEEILQDDSEAAHKGGVLELITQKLEILYYDKAERSRLIKVLNLEQEEPQEFSDLETKLRTSYDDYVTSFCETAGRKDKKFIHIRVRMNFNTFWQVFYGWMLEKQTS